MLAGTRIAVAPCTDSESSLQAQARFNQRANTYEHHAQVQQDMACWLSKWLPEATNNPADSNQSALDLGAGNGTFTRYLADRFSRLHALEAAANMVTLGQRNLPEATWQQGDAWTLQPLQERSRDFDLITSSSLLQWCPQPQQTLQHWAELCKPGTRMLHGFYIEPTLWQWQKIFANAGLIHWRSAAQWSEAFVQSNWQILRSETCVRDYRFGSALELARSLHGTGVTPGQGSLSPGRFRSLLRQYDANFAAASEPAAQEENQAATQPVTAPGVIATWAFFRIEVIRR